MSTPFKTRIMTKADKKPRKVQGNGDSISMAIILQDPAKLDAVVKANKIGDKVKAASEYPNFGRFVMTLSNVLRGKNRKEDVTVGSFKLPAGGEPTPELIEAFENAEDAAISYTTKRENERIAAANAKKADKEAKAKARADKAAAPAAEKAPKKGGKTAKAA